MGAYETCSYSFCLFYFIHNRTVYAVDQALAGVWDTSKTGLRQRSIHCDLGRFIDLDLIQFKWDHWEIFPEFQFNGFNLYRGFNVSIRFIDKESHYFIAVDIQCSEGCTNNQDQHSQHKQNNISDLFNHLAKIQLQNTCNII